MIFQIFWTGIRDASFLYLFSLVFYLRNFYSISIACSRPDRKQHQRSEKKESFIIAQGNIQDFTLTWQATTSPNPFRFSCAIKWSEGLVNYYIQKQSILKFKSRTGLEAFTPIYCSLRAWNPFSISTSIWNPCSFKNVVYRD